MAKVSVSIMGANFANTAVEKARSADMIHFDICDGEFVPEKTIWADYLLAVHDVVKDVHLMIENPVEDVEEFIDAGADRIAFHIEATEVPQSVIGLIQSRGCKAGIALNPETPAEEIVEFLDEIDFVLIMSVHPGKGGQKFMPEVLDKVKFLKKKAPELEIAIDGGINPETGKQAVEAGVDTLIAGNYVYSMEPEIAIGFLKQI